ncbi:metalloprotease ATP23 [Gaeumannomyces tritici R3-111a-1]|uniref:Mitochondrial inner membrane protease ATP23 n=1 Tax=Gaeumannomyces tritici (strain R3-111a-1) TaxID=644352 RepID=J3NJG7_GAET3|nr:metalloprotease ATP23 [Gaeumannomyces tritici R3-111a-1]EJT81419.1 metalloprotease ATP23 [Gaeumannomyces tritici R3-111a-1]
MSSSTTTPPPPQQQQPPAATATPAAAGGEAFAGGIRKNDPARTGFDPKTQWWVNYFSILSGRMTREGQFHYREWREAENEERDCRRCEEYRDWLFRFSPVVRFMRERVASLNGTLDAGNVVCRRCPSRLAEDGTVRRQGGGFSPAHGIRICANNVRDRRHLEDTLAHEMVHAWDHLRWKVDFGGRKDLKHAACTEIRASMLSGECRWTRETFTRGHWTLTQQFQNCVRSRAIQSVMARPTCKDEEHASKAVNQVWDSCFADTRPFDEVYR